jgi:hypothetical protein
MDIHAEGMPISGVHLEKVLILYIKYIYIIMKSDFETKFLIAFQRNRLVRVKVSLPNQTYGNLGIF